MDRCQHGITSLWLGVTLSLLGLKMFVASCCHHHQACQTSAFGVMMASPPFCLLPSPSLQSPSWASLAWPHWTSLGTWTLPACPCRWPQTLQRPWSGRVSQEASSEDRSPCSHKCGTILSLTDMQNYISSHFLSFYHACQQQLEACHCRPDLSTILEALDAQIFPFDAIQCVLPMQQLQQSSAK